MPIDPEQLVLTARDLLTELPESVVFSRDNLLALVKPAIALWQQRTNDDPQKRQNFIVASDPITVSMGVADMSDQIELRGYRLEFIKESDIEIAYGTGTPQFTVKFVNSLDRLKMKGRQDQFFVLAYLQGATIRFKDAGAALIDAMEGTFTLHSVVMPVNLDEMNKAVMPEIALIVAELAKQELSQQNRGLDIPVK